MTITLGIHIFLGYRSFKNDGTSGFVFQPHGTTLYPTNQGHAEAGKPSAGQN